MRIDIDSFLRTDIDWILCRSLQTGAVVQPVHLGDVKYRLNGAAQVHDGEDRDADLAVQLDERVGRGKRHERHRWQIVDHDDSQKDDHHFKGFLLHRMHDLFASDTPAQHPDDRQVAEDHDEEGRQDEAAEHLGHTHCSQNAFGDRIGQDERPYKG